MILFLSLSIGCALFEKQTSPQGEDPEIDDLDQDTDASTADSGETDDPVDDSGDSDQEDDSGSGTSDDSGGDTQDDSGSSSTGDPATDLANSIDCDGEYSDVGEPDEQECFTGFLQCGDVIASNTGDGGSTFFDAELYQDWYAMASNNSDYSSPERVYYLLHPGTGTVQVSVKSPCENTDLWYFKTYDDDFGECPYETCSPCRNDNDHSGKNSFQDDVVDMFDTSSSGSYMIVVESQSGDDAPFVLSVTCP